MATSCNRCCKRCVILTAVFLLLMVGIIGCGQRHPKTYPVEGKVVFDDGTPLAGGKIELRPLDPPADRWPNPIGVIGSDGSFRLTTFEPFDGAPPGRYGVIVMELQYEIKPGQPPPKPIIDPKYSHYETSGLELEIGEKSNTPTITVTRP